MDRLSAFHKFCELVSFEAFESFFKFVCRYTEMCVMTDLWPVNIC